MYAKKRTITDTPYEESLNGLLAAEPSLDANAHRADAVASEVVIYTIPWCPYCRSAKACSDD